MEPAPSAIVPPAIAKPLLEQMRQHPFGAQATIIGQVTNQHPRVVVARTQMAAHACREYANRGTVTRIC